MSKNNSKKEKRKLKVINGGADMEAVMPGRLATMTSANVEQKSDWEVLAEICSASAKKKGLTKEDSKRILLQVRQMDENNC